MGIDIGKGFTELCNTIHPSISFSSTPSTMSVSFIAPDLQPTYHALVNGTSDYDWALFTQSGNELKVEETGNGLDDLSEEFQDGR